MKVVQRNPDPFLFQGGEIGLLLIHGFTGTTAELRPMGEYFHQAGYTVHAPLLAGHGTTPEEMATTSSDDWYQSVYEAYQLLKENDCTHIHAIGLSMGGILAFQLSLKEQVQSVSSLCTPVFIKDRRIHFCRFLQYVKQYSNHRKEKEAHIEPYLYSYERTPIRCIAALQSIIKETRKRLIDVKVPVFIAQAEKDETVRPRSALHIHRRLGSEAKELKWYPRSSHMITLDRERKKLFQDIHQFIKKQEAK